MDLKEEIELLEKKVSLLKQAQELQEIIGKAEQPPVRYAPITYPVCPTPCPGYPSPWGPVVAWGNTNAGVNG